MVLPTELEEAYHREIIEFEENKKMRYITTAERIGMKKGIEKGRMEGSLKKAIKTAKNLSFV